MDDNSFERPQSRSPLRKLEQPEQQNSPKRLSIIERENAVLMDEIITTNYLAGANIIHEIQKKDVVMRVINRTMSDDFKSISPKENWEFEIHQDNTEDAEMNDEENDVGNIKSEEENKENLDPGISNTIEIDWRKAGSTKRKHSND